MNRTAMCIRMLQLLKGRGFMSREEIAAELEVNIRNVAEYRKELEAAGYTILSVSGRYGGYSLLADPLLAAASLSEEEKQGLRETLTYLKSHPDFISGQVAAAAIDKMLSNTPLQENHTGFYLSHEYAPISPKMRTFIQTTKQAIKERQCLELNYRSMKDAQAKEIRVHPYELIHYKGAYYCIAYSLSAKDFRTYKFSEERMKECCVLANGFQRDNTFDLTDHIGTLGLVKNELLAVEMELYQEAAIFCAERQIGLHPQFHWQKDGSLYYQTLFEGKQEALSFILSLGNQVRIHSPHSLCKEIKEQAQIMLAYYSE